MSAMWKAIQKHVCPQCRRKRPGQKLWRIGKTCYRNHIIDRRDFTFGFGASVILSNCAVARASQIDPIERLKAIE